MKINCIVQARMGSTRFPGKVMVEVAGKPLIGHLLDRIKDADVDKIIVAMPLGVNPLFEYVNDRFKAYGDCTWVLGSEKDVASRFYDALKGYPCDAFIRVCADSPVVDAGMVNHVAEALRCGCWFVHFTGGIDGTQVQGIRTELFLRHVEDFDEYDREHVLSYFTRTRSLTVDEPDDLKRVEPILKGDMDFDDWMTRKCT